VITIRRPAPEPGVPFTLDEDVFDVDEE
ncbi:MAG: hypothetical protein RL119_673, partial [Actinomycetota bacterium]